MVAFFENVGLTSEDVGIKVNSRLVVSEVLSELGVPDDKFAETCVLIDKLDKMPLDAIQDDLAALGLTTDTVKSLLDILTNNSVSSLESVLPPNSKAISELKLLLSLCEHYGISDWIQVDASVIRGLAYYTGTVFEAFDRQGVLRAIAGGGRYDKLLETFGGDPTPAAGFGFGDAVIVELLKERNLLPSFGNAGIDTVVFAMNSDLQGAAIEIATLLRKEGQSVDIVLEKKKPKWVFKHADRLQATNVAFVAPDEYANGEVSMKNLETGEQSPIKIDSLSEWAKNL